MYEYVASFKKTQDIHFIIRMGYNTAGVKQSLEVA